MKWYSRIKSYTAVEWLLFIAIISFQSPWFIWEYGLSVYLQYFSISALLILFVKHNRLKGGKGLPVFFLLLFYFVIGQVFNKVHLSYFFIVFAFILAVRITQKESVNVLNMLTNYLFLSIIIPLPFWLIHQYVYPLPLFDVTDIGDMKSTSSTLMENYFFFVTFQGMDAMRFYSWYDEPGVLGTLAPFILFANKFNMKDRRIPIILVGCIFTYSMAYFILTLIGWAYTARSSLKSIIATTMGVFIIGFGMFYFLKNNDAFQTSVVTRFMNYETHGVESRINYQTDLLWNKSLDSGKLILGNGSGAMDEFGGIAASYKSFILEFGYVGCFMLFVAYYSLLKRRDQLGLFTLFLFALSFLQRPQLFTAGWFLLFACVIGHLYRNGHETR